MKMRASLSSETDITAFSQDRTNYSRK